MLGYENIIIQILVVESINIEAVMSCSVHGLYPPCLRGVQQLHGIGGSTDGLEINNLNSLTHLFSFNVDHYVDHSVSRSI